VDYLWQTKVSNTKKQNIYISRLKKLKVVSLDTCVLATTVTNNESGNLQPASSMYIFQTSSFMFCLRHSCDC
jgi:hypothetical protein